MTMPEWLTHRLDEKYLSDLSVEEQGVWVATRLVVAKRLAAELRNGPDTVNIDPLKMRQQLQCAQADYAQWQDRLSA
jgi:hypothetical protein